MLIENPKFIECRSLGHAWTLIESDWEPADTLVFDPLSVQCLRCGCERHDEVWHSDGQLATRRYTHTDGYLLPKGERRPKRHEFRLVMLRNAFDTKLPKRKTVK